MTEKFYDSLSDTSRLKERLMSLFYSKEELVRLIMPKLDDDNFTREQNWYGGLFEKAADGQTEIVTLTGHCFDTSYIEGTLAEGQCAVYLESGLSKAENRHFKEVSMDIMVVCHKDALRLSEEDKNFYNAMGVYGNRVDSAVQIIHSCILGQSMADEIKESYAVGSLNLAGENPLKQYIPDTKFYGKCLSYTYHSFYQRKGSIR